MTRGRLAGVLALLASLTAPAALSAQGNEPLHKTDIVRLLATPLIGQGEVADLIRRNCLAFRPTARDWSDFRALGASPEILSSIGGCGEQRSAVAAAQPLAAVALTPQVAVEAGREAAISVLLKRGGVVQPGVTLTLKGSGPLAGQGAGAGAPDAQAVTDANGVAEFHVPAGPRVAVYAFPVTLPSGAAPAGDAVVTLDVRHAPPAVVTLLPARLDLTTSTGPLAVQAEVTDSMGNPIPHEPIQLGGQLLERGVVTDTTDSLGRASLTVPRAAIHHAGEIAVLVRGRRLATLPVAYSDAISPAASGFVASPELSGIVRRRLNEPLVFQVRNVSGAAVAGRLVSFTGDDADVAPDSALTDSMGQAKVFVTLGTEAGVATVTGVIDSVRKRIEIRVVPSADVAVTIERDGVPVTGGRVVVALDTSFTLRVSARDSYGNTVRLTSLVRALEAERSRFNFAPQLLRVVRVDSDSLGATLTFFPTALGSATLNVVGATVTVAVVRHLPAR